MNTVSQWSKQGACFARATQLSFTTPVSCLANEFDVRETIAKYKKNSVKSCHMAGKNNAIEVV